MDKRTLHRLIPLLAALVMAVSLLTGCGTKTAEQVQQQEDAQTIQVYRHPADPRTGRPRTGNAFDEDRRNALESGMNGFLSKPIVIGDLVQELRKIL